MNKLRILCIAPYEGLAQTVREVMKTRDDILLTLRIGNLADGLEVLRSVDEDDYDVILSRGGTAKLIAQNTTKPLVEIHSGIYDYLRVIHLVGSYSNNFAIVGFQNAMLNINELMDLVKPGVEVIAITDAQSARDALKKLREKGCTAIIGDTIAVREAAALQMNGIMIPSGAECINDALDEAARLFAWLKHGERERRLLRDVCVQAGIEYALFDENDQLLINRTTFDLNLAEIRIAGFLRRVRNLGTAVGLRRLQDKAIRLDGRVYNYSGKECALITFSVKSGAWNGSGLSDLNLGNDASYQDNVGAMQGMIKQISSAAVTKDCIVPIAEKGQDISALMRSLCDGVYKNRLLLKFDCRRMSKKALDDLVEKENSPLAENDQLIYWECADALPEEQQRKLAAYMRDSNLTGRNKVVALFEPKSSSQPLFRYLLDEATSILLRIPPLRERKQDIAILASQLTSAYNYIFGKQIVEYAPEAIQTIVDYSWPENSSQLYRVVKKLVLQSEDSKISAAAVEEALREESALVRSEYISAPPGGTLDEIIHDVVSAVLKEENMSKTRTAERLGIGRTTLWRILNR